MKELLNKLVFVLISGTIVGYFYIVYLCNKDFREALKQEDDEFTFIG